MNGPGWRFIAPDRKFRAIAALVPPVEQTSEALLARVGEGDTQAFEVIFDRHGATVFGLVRAVLGDPHEAEEVTQEVLLEVWRRAPGFDAARGSARAWVYTIAHHRAIDRVRSSQAARLRDERVVTTQGERDFDMVLEEVESRLEAERLRHCLEGLTPRQHAAVTLAYYRGYSYAEVAELLKLPVGTVKTRMRAGFIRLRDCLATGLEA